MLGPPPATPVERKHSMPSIPTYHLIVKNNIRNGFNGVDEHNFNTLADHCAPDIYHRFAGEHSLGGERHDADTFVAWLQRVERVLPDLRLTITDITVSGLPNNTTAVARWNAHATLADGGQPYVNHGLHFIRLRWFKIVYMDVYQDSQLLAAALKRQSTHGIPEATAAPITS